MNKDTNRTNHLLDIARRALDKIGASEEEIEEREEAPSRFGQGRGSRRTGKELHGSQNERRDYHGVVGQLG